jgi:hypothetical protein
MSMISLVSMPTDVETDCADHSFRTLVLFCFVGLVASLNLMARGIDLSAGLM